MARCFSKRQRRALLLFANGKCQECGTHITMQTMHADHRIPWVAGGQTQITNGQALCAKCNQEKRHHMRLPKISNKHGQPLEYRRWQKEALAVAIERITGGRSSIFLNVCPGGGKTPFGVAFARWGIDAGYIEKVIVVVPRKKIRDQWVNLLQLNRVTAETIKNEHAIGRMEAGSMPKRAVVLTYQMAQWGAVPDYLELICAKYKTLVIGDEIHWTGIHDHISTKWGEAFSRATASARFVIPLSGTPFREDFYRLPFLQYGEEGTGTPDYTFDYAEALDAGDVTPIFFEDHTGIIHFKRRINDMEETMRMDFADGLDGVYYQQNGEPDEQKMNQRLAAALHNSSGFWKDIMRAAIAKLDQIRMTEQSNAGGIVFARDQSHALAIAGFIAMETKENPAVIISNEDHDIDGFAESKKAWVVSVRMINEGVDIERLRVAVMLTNVTTRKNFMQSVARCIRVDASGIPSNYTPERYREAFKALAMRQWAFVYMPADPRFKQWAIEFKNAINDRQLEPPPADTVPGGAGAQVRAEYVVDESEVELGGATFGEEYWTAEEIEESLDEMRKGYGEKETEALLARFSKAELGAITSAIIRKQR